MGIGWGVLAEGSSVASSVLQQVTIQAVAANTSYCRNVDLADVSTQFCAGLMPEGGKGEFCCINEALIYVLFRYMPG